MLGKAWAFSKFYHTPVKDRAKEFAGFTQTDEMWRSVSLPVKADITAVHDFLSPKLTPVFTHPKKFDPASLAALVKPK